jgi:response regulator NasT
MSGSGRLRVLVADDDPSERSCLRAQLSHLGHLVVAEARDGQEAVSFARQLRPDLVVMDVEMPGMDKLAASEQIDRERMCPIILLSAYGEPESVRRACCLSAVQSYLIKPVAEQDLGPVIELAVDRFRRARRIRREATRKQSLLDIRSTLDRAIHHLVARDKCSTQEARERIWQEARARKAGLDEAALAVLVEEPVNPCLGALI